MKEPLTQGCYWTMGEYILTEADKTDAENLFD